MKNCHFLVILKEIWSDFWANLKICKNPILIGIRSNSLHKINTSISIRKCNENGEFFPNYF